MGRKKLWFISKAAVCCVLFCPRALPLQAPGLARLTVTSKPDHATIAINGNVRKEQTDATFVVGPGTYTVEVSGGPGNLKCGRKAVTVSAGQEVRVSCTSSGWE